MIPQIKTKNLELLTQGDIRVRIAPSPTGNLHIGTARTALFNFLYARKNKGSFVLRIEDTDKERSTQSFEKDIFEGLRWLGLDWDEGPVYPQRNSDKYFGEYSPYRQSERINKYQVYIKKLLEEDKAYHCFCSEKELTDQKQYQMATGRPPIYNGACSKISKKECKEMISKGKKSVIRFRNPIKKIKFKDLIRGDIEFNSETIGDIVIAKDEKTPLYNLAVVLDDFEMNITHVIRGEDHISNTPKQILIAEALEITPPKFAHLPLVLGSDKSKLSKRHGAVSLSEYKELGYLPEAMINFMVFLGWNPGSEREIYSISSLMKDFSIEKIQKSGAMFNIKKLDFINSFYIKQKNIESLTELCIPYMIKDHLIYQSNENFKEYKRKEDDKDISLEEIQRIVLIHQDRIKKLSEISELTEYFFKKIEYDEDLLIWKNSTKNKTIKNLDNIENILHKIDIESWNKENIELIVMTEAEKTGDRGSILWPLRVALTGKKASAGPIEVAEILGKEETIKRIKNAKNL